MALKDTIADLVSNVKTILPDIVRSIEIEIGNDEYNPTTGTVTGSNKITIKALDLGANLTDNERLEGIDRKILINLKDTADDIADINILNGTSIIINTSKYSVTRITQDALEATAELSLSLKETETV